MSMPFSAGKGKGRKHFHIPGSSGASNPPPPPPPPPPPGTITMEITREKGSNGAGTVHIECFVLPGVITSQAAADQCVVKIAGVEVACELTARGQHSDGSYSILQGYASIASISAGVPVAMTIETNGTPTVARTIIAGKYAYTRNSADPRLAGYPDVIALPTDIEYLRKCRFTGPFDLQSRASVVALGGKYQTFWERFEDFSDWWWNHNAGAGTYGHAPPQQNNMAWSKCNTNNAAFNNFSDWNLTDPSQDFAQWRIFSSWITSFLYSGNSYDNGKTHIEAFLQTAQRKYFIRGSSFIAHYVHEYVHDQEFPGSVGLNGFQIFPDGVACIYLLYNDLIAKRCLEVQAHRYVALAYITIPDAGIGFSALLSDPPGTIGGFDPRECGRPLQLCLAGHRARLTESYWTGEEISFPFDYAAKATVIVERMLQTGQERYMRKADGTWREQRCTDSSGMYINTFMLGILAYELLKYYEQINANFAIVTALRQCWDTIYATLWGTWDYTFDSVNFFTATVKSMRNNFDGQCASLDVPHPNLGDSSTFQLGFYATWAAWLYKKTGIASYLSQADEVFSEGVGTSTNAGSGPTLGELRSVSLLITEPVTRKVFGEAHTTIMPFFTYRLG